MPAYTPRTAVRQSVETVVFDAANPDAVRVLNGNFDQWMVDQDNGLTTGVVIMNQGRNTATGAYTISCAAYGAAFTLINVSFDYSGTALPKSSLLNSRLTLDMSTVAATQIFWSIPQSSLLPSAYYPGTGTTYTLDVSTFTGLGMGIADGGVVPIAGNSSSVFKMGSVWHYGADPDNDFYFGLLSSGGDQGLYKAFKTPGLSSAVSPDSLTSWTDGALNYAYGAFHDGSPHHFLTEWTKAAYPAGAFSYANFNITLSDPTDDAFFQDYFYGGGATWYSASNGENFCVTRNITFPLTSAMAFVFNADMTEYTKYVIDFDGSMEDGMFFIDEFGGQWLNGYTADGSALSVYIGGTASPDLTWSEQPTTVQNPDINRLRAWPFTLDGHEYWALRLGEEATLVYDLTTQQWAEWTNEDWDVWRLSVGLNWGSQDIVAGDLRDGQIWNIDPVARVDDVDYKITSIITGGLPVRGLDAVPCHVLLTAAVGEPSVATGCGVKLESSDDEGNTWTDHGTLDVTDGDYNQLKWLSIGQMEAPGRVFRFTDIGATTRIDGADTLDG